MARIIIDTTPAQDQAAQIVFQRDTLKDPALTLLQWAKLRVTDVLDGWVLQTEGESRVRRAALFTKATAAEQATINAILDQYR